MVFLLHSFVSTSTHRSMSNALTRTVMVDGSITQSTLSQMSIGQDTKDTISKLRCKLEVNNFGEFARNDKLLTVISTMSYVLKLLLESGSKMYEGESL